MTSPLNTLVRTHPGCPLDALSERWAAFGKEATTAFATRATSHAFAALAEEGTALRHCITASRQQRWRGALCWSERFNEHECAIRALTQAATHWFDAAYVLECHTATCTQDERTQQDLQALLGLALEQRLRVWTIAHHLLREQVTQSPQHHLVDAIILGEETPR